MSKKETQTYTHNLKSNLNKKNCEKGMKHKNIFQQVMGFAHGYRQGGEEVMALPGFSNYNC